MLIDKVRRVVKTIINTDVRGNFTPEEYNDILYQVINEKFEEYLFEINRLVNRQNRGLLNGGLENATDRFREKILHYLYDATIDLVGNTYTLPTDYRYLDAIYLKTGAEVELCKNSREFKIVSQLVDTKPSTSYPIGLQSGNRIKIAPTDYASSLEVSYLRQPKKPKWTYTVIGGAEVFNPSANDFQDIDMHISEESDIVIRVLQRFGVNLKEQDLQGIIDREEQQQMQQANNL